MMVVVMSPVVVHGGYKTVEGSSMIIYWIKSDIGQCSSSCSRIGMYQRYEMSVEIY